MVTTKKKYVKIQKCIKKQEEQKLTKVKFVSITFVLLFVGFSISNLSMAETNLLKPPVIGEDGLYQQEWFHESFLDLEEDLAEARVHPTRATHRLTHNNNPVLLFVLF